MKILVVISSILLALPCFAITITVDDDAPADYSNIQDAIDNSNDWDVVEVQPGTYYENINFYGKSITVTGSDANDMGVIYGTVIDGGMTGNTVTFDSGEDDNSELIGLTIENGGKGIYCYYSDPYVYKCVVRYSQTGAGIDGVAAFPVIEECTVRENGSYGISECDGQIKNCEIHENASAGLYHCDSLILGCTISDNLSYGLSNCDGEIKDCHIEGNSIGLYDCYGQIKECVIRDNTSYGIRAYCPDGSNVEILNCIVTGNQDHGIYFSSWANSVTNRVTNCTIVGNKGDGITVDNNYSSCTAFLSNNIVVNNGAYGINDSSSGVTTLKYNNLWDNTSGNYTGLQPGETDTHSNPFFAVDGYWDSGNWIEGEYYIKSIAGRWTGSEWTNDGVTSPCVDAGDPIGGYFSEPVPNGDRINQGAYGGTIYASKSPYGPEPYCGDHIPYDTNDDCKINLEDFAEWATYWMECNLVPQSACSE